MCGHAGRPHGTGAMPWGQGPDQERRVAGDAAARISSRRSQTARGWSRPRFSTGMPRSCAMRMPMAVPPRSAPPSVHATTPSTGASVSAARMATFRAWSFRAAGRAAVPRGVQFGRDGEAAGRAVGTERAAVRPARSRDIRARAGTGCGWRERHRRQTRSRPRQPRRNEDAIHGARARRPSRSWILQHGGVAWRAIRCRRRRAQSWSSPSPNSDLAGPLPTQLAGRASAIGGTDGGIQRGGLFLALPAASTRFGPTAISMSQGAEGGLPGPVRPLSRRVPTEVGKGRRARAQNGVVRLRFGDERSDGSEACESWPESDGNAAADAQAAPVVDRCDAGGEPARLPGSPSV